MQIHDAGRFAARGGGPQALLAELVGQIGHSHFDTGLLDLSRSAVGADHVTAFATTAGGGIRTVAAENGGPRSVARAVAGRYVQHHWRGDPVARLLSERAGEDRRVVVDMDADDVEKGDYRRECYAAIHLDHRLTVAECRNGRTMRLNFYRGRGADFRDEDIGCVGGMADMLLAMLWRHDEAMAVQPADDVEACFKARLARLEPALSERERQVCALIGLGVTSEGIGLRLDIGLNTVLTYRKRAYARLGISSQNELMRRLMM
ncbi:MAG: helix-turn-helix transcriptional regulator [Rhizobiales bacterium]|nr:helix-turn-helix transcriptional regulator [Hyphomicrobiales bacterium]